MYHYRYEFRFIPADPQYGWGDGRELVRVADDLKEDLGRYLDLLEDDDVRLEHTLNTLKPLSDWLNEELEGLLIGQDLAVFKGNSMEVAIATDEDRL